MTMELKDKIKAARKKLGITQEQAGTQWSIPLSTLRKWERGANAPRGFALKQVNELLEKIIKGEKRKPIK